MLWLGGVPMEHVLGWLIGFVVLTIAAERVELARITMGAAAGGRLLVHAWSIVLALLVALALPGAGAVLLGASLLALAAWLVVNDIARRTVRAHGVTRYMAASILCGYVWLVVAAVTLLFGAPGGRAAYDAVVHAVFLGYTMSMIMAHATSILPAVLRIALPYRAAFWAPVVLLQAALIVRLWLGDGFGMPWAWQTGGVLGVAALLLFVLTAVTSAALGAPRRAPRVRQPEGAAE